MPSLRKMLITFILTVPCLMPKAAPIISLVIGYGDNHIPRRRHLRSAGVLSDSTPESGPESNWPAFEVKLEMSSIPDAC